MCVEKPTLPDGTVFACRRCEQCAQLKINEWAGRIIAESKTTPVTYYVTLTYGPDQDGNKDHVRAYFLTYSDIQNYLKRIRSAYGKFRYFVAGEYGGKRDRCHWHVILYCQKAYPNIRLNDIFNRDPKWPHGTSLWEKFELHNAFYCAKYVQEDKNSDFAPKYESSKRPPLGDTFFRRLAKTYVDQGLAPQDLFYRHREIVKRNGEPRKFMMKRKTAENFCQEFVDQWRKKTPWKHIPKSPVIDAYLDKSAARLNELEEMQQLTLAAEEAAYNRTELEAHYGAINENATHYNTHDYTYPVDLDAFTYKRFPGDPKKIDPSKFKNKTTTPENEIPLP